MTRRFIKVADNEPPVSTDERRIWLELYIPERVQGDETRKGLTMGLYMGGGAFRLAGQRNVTTERVGAWRYLAGHREAITQEVAIRG